MEAAKITISREQEDFKNFEEESNERLDRLFRACDDAYFWGKMSKTVKIRWSKRMTECAGTTLSAYKKQPITISLSRQILEMRPFIDLLETLLHEMIHAYIWAEKVKEKEEHGPIFHGHMKRVGNLAGVDLQVCHDFRDECELLLKHVWRCNGPCRKMAPNRGYVRRAINREPSNSEKWFREHNLECGGKFVKIQAPNPTKTGKNHEFDYRLDEEIESFLKSSFPKYSKQCSVKLVKITRDKKEFHRRSVTKTMPFDDLPKTKNPKVKTTKTTTKNKILQNKTFTKKKLDKVLSEKNVIKTDPIELPKTENAKNLKTPNQKLSAENSKVKTAKTTTKNKIPSSKTSAKKKLDKVSSEKNVIKADPCDLPKTENKKNFETPNRKLSAGLRVKYKLTNRKSTPYPMPCTDCDTDLSYSFSDSPVMSISKNSQHLNDKQK